MLPHHLTDRGACRPHKVVWALWVTAVVGAAQDPLAAPAGCTTSWTTIAVWRQRLRGMARQTVAAAGSDWCCAPARCRPCITARPWTAAAGPNAQLTMTKRFFDAAERNLGHYAREFAMRACIGSRSPKQIVAWRCVATLCNLVVFDICVLSMQSR